MELKYFPTDLLPRLGWEVEDQHTEEANQHRGEDQVDRVEESLPPDRDVERDVRLCGLDACNTINNIFWSRSAPFGLLKAN